MKKRKLIIIISSIILFLIISYFVGGFIATNIILNNIFDKRGSDEALLLNYENRIYKLRYDYECLKERKEYDFNSRYKLKGYYYKNINSKGLVIACHGMGSMADGFDSEYQSYFVENGYSLFSFDLSASGKSEGESMVGLFQSAYDVKAAYDFLKKENLLEDNLILIGHSWGGFGVAASLSLGVEAKYVITFSAFDNQYDTTIRFAKNYMGDIINLSIPPFYISTNLKYGSDNTFSASDSLKNSNAKALVIHGKLDDKIPYNEGLYGKISDIPNAYGLLLDDEYHNGIWRSSEANNYSKELLEELNKLEKEEDKEAFVNNIDKNKTSELNKLLFEKIEEFINN